MQRRLLRRLAALTLAAALVGPSAFAAPARLHFGSVWISAWEWVTSLWVEVRPDGDPWRRPGDQADLGPEGDPGG